MRTIVDPHTSDVFQRLIRHPTLLSAQRLLGDEVYVFQIGVNDERLQRRRVVLAPGLLPLPPQHDHIPTPNMVNTLIFLDEVNMLNGPLMIVPGSYRHVPEQPRGLRRKGLRTPSTTPAPTTVTELVSKAAFVAPTRPASSTIFMHVNTLHGSTANTPWPPANDHADLQHDVEQGHEPEHTSKAHRL